MATQRRRNGGGRGRARGQHGGVRENAGRRTMFPGKYADGVPLAKLGLTVSPLALARLESVQAQIETLPPVGPKTLSDAAEYCIRKATRTALDA